MGEVIVDILVPVWNRPVETRNCLVRLIEYSPRGKIILIDYGSDRETQRLLEDFADGLGDRAVLLRMERNEGFVRALNRGMTQTEAPLLAVVSNTSLVSAGWLEPLLRVAAQQPEAGLVIPRLVAAGVPLDIIRTGTGSAPVETAYGSFAAMVIRKTLYDRLGGFAEDLDGALWCLKDYSRKALQAGFLTFLQADSSVSYVDAVVLGSVARREALLRHCSAAYAARWGKERAFCIYFPKDVNGEEARRMFAVMLQGARQGHRFAVLASSRLLQSFTAAGFTALHAGLTFVSLPRFFAERKAAKVYGRLVATEPGWEDVNGFRGTLFPENGAHSSWEEIEQYITELGKKYRAD